MGYAQSHAVRPLSEYQRIVHYVFHDNSDEKNPEAHPFCRYCPTTSADQFRSKSHTVPEGLGNKWLISKDECDACNSMFAAYDDSLCKSAGPLLTISEIKGKTGKVRQTGRSKSHNIKHDTSDNDSRVVFTVFDQASGISMPTGTYVSIDEDGANAWIMPAPIETFSPVLAFKALCKIGLAVLPVSDLQNFLKLRDWVMDANSADGPFDCWVGLSIVGACNPDTRLSVNLFRKQSSVYVGPDMLLILTAGRMCWQINLLTDAWFIDSDSSKNRPFNIPVSAINRRPIQFSSNAVFDDSAIFNWKAKAPTAGPIRSIGQKIVCPDGAWRWEVSWNPDDRWFPS